jgi:hypothetical protein
MPTLIASSELNFAGILVEKPAAISIDELLGNEGCLRPIQDKVFIAYNRRFYPSVQKALELIKEDGVLQSMHFEFTEWSHRIEPLQKAPGVKENWFFANSTHVVDLAFFLAGEPKEFKAIAKPGNIPWHSKIILNPLEKLKFVLRGTVAEEEVQLDIQLNGAEMLKPGLLEQLRAFLQLGGNESALKTLSQHTSAAERYLLEIVQG